MQNFLKNCMWNVVPLAVAGIVWLVGYIYIYIEPLRSYNCAFTAWSILCSDAVGFPARQLAYWYIPLGILMLFVSLTVLKRWAIFATLFFILSLIAIYFAPVSPFFGKETIAMLAGASLFIITAVWIAIYFIVLWWRQRHAKIL